MSVKRILCLLLALAAFFPAFGQNLSVDYKAEIPAIRKAYDAFKGDRFDIVSIACSDKREDTIEALGELDMPWNQILDAQKIPVELYGVATIPHLILFAPDGTILKRGLRGEQIYATMQDILK